MNTALIVLAAGKGTRMNSDLPKVLHPVAGVPMLTHVQATGAALSPEHTVIVTGHGGAAVASAARAADASAMIVTQGEQLGTGHAVDQAREALAEFDGVAIVLFGDTPFIRQETLQSMLAAAQTHDVVILGFEPDDPGRYGRLVMDGNSLERIVEFKDATDEERQITLCNGGVTACNSKVLFSLLSEVSNDNASGEYYLTDIVGLARARGLSATAVTCAEEETIGINTRAQLAQADGYFQNEARTSAMQNGVTLMAPETVYFAHDTMIGRDSVIEPNIVFGPGVTIESGAHIRAFSHLEGCHVSRGAIVGPYARLRPGAELSEDVRIGNFVEIKGAEIGAGSKVNHLSYVGDAAVGEGANIGAGTVTCNYDGVMKHRTEIGNGAFIGSNTMLVAPVSVGDGAITGSGSVITEDVEPDAIALARAPQTQKRHMAAKLFKLLKAKKAKQQKG